MVTSNARSIEELITERTHWLSDAHARYKKEYVALHLSTHGLLLQIDLEAAFRGGAWASVIVMAQSVIESTIRDLVTSDYEIKPKALFKGAKRLERIRNLRNQLVHPQAPGSPSLVWRVGGGDCAANHALLESDAKKAVEYMLYILYQQRVSEQTQE